MIFLEYSPFIYVGIIALFTILIAYHASDIFMNLGGTKRLWFFIILFFNVYFFIFANLAMLSRKHRAKIKSKDRRKIIWILICFVILITIPIIAARLIGVDPIF